MHDLVETADCYAPTEFMHELHGPDNCGIYCQLRYEIRPYGHYAPTDVEFYHDMHDPENYGEKCATPSDGKSDISAICDIGEISENFKAVSGVPDVCDICASCDVGDMCKKGPGKISLESGDILAVSDFVSDFDPGPGEPLLRSGVSLNMPNFAGDVDILQVSVIPPESGIMFAMSDFVREPLLQSGISLNMPNFAGVVDVSHVPNFASVSDSGPGTISLESGNMLAMSDFVCDFDPGPGEPLLRSGVSLNMPNFAGNVDKLRLQDFVSAIDSGPGTTSPGFGDTLAVPDLVSDIDPGPGEPLLESEVRSDKQHFVSNCERLLIQDFVSAIDSGPGTTSPGFGDTLAVLVFARFTIMMFIVALLQSVLSGSCQEVCVAGSCAGPSGGPSFVIVLFAFVAASVQFDPRVPEFVTTLASRTQVSAQPQLDVIQLCPSSSRSGWSTLLSGAGMLLSAVSALLRWDFLCYIRAMARCGLGAHKGPLYGYACVRCGTQRAIILQ